MGIISVLNVAGMCQNAVVERQWRTNQEQRTKVYKGYKMKSNDEKIFKKQVNT